MVVGGGMPSNSRIVPSPALMSAVASTDISRQQREQDLANALGRRRPTQGSVSSTGSGDHYRPNPPVSTMSELPFNGNAGVDYGMGTTAAAQASRYRTALPNQPTVDMRVGRSASTASSSSGGYRGSYAPSPFATQRRPLQATPEQNQLRKQSSTISVNNSGRYVQAPGGNYDRIGGAAAGSPDMHHAHLGSRSAPDLNLDAMKSAINAVSHDLDSNPVPQIPTAYSGTAHNALPQHHQLHHSHLATSHPLAAASTLSIKTDLSQSDVPAQVGALYTAPTAQLEDVPSTSTGNIASRHSSRSSEPAVASGGRMAPKTPMTSDLTATAISPGSSVAAPVNTELVALLENVRPVYPAMLSLVANTFYEIMSQVLQTHTRNGLEYTECFTGRDAVDAIYAIIKAADRNLAIVVGRALEQQKLFHDVDYEKRLRDDSNELYAFDSDTIRALTRAEVSAEEDDDEVDEASTLNHEPVIRRNESFQDSGSSARVPPSVINGVFVMLTDCYSPTCSSTQPCYSVTCPRQRSQQDHLRKTAKSNVATEMKQEKLWSMSVPKEVLKSVSRQELDRQERLYEVFYGEKDYVRDLCILRDLYMKPLHNGDIVREDRRKNFITKVFKNALAILAENMELQRALEKRQKESFVCYQVGDVFLPFVQHLEAYLEYCANQPYSMYFLEAEKRTNTKLVEFLEKTDRRPECRKLGVQHFLTRPPTRLARYPLVLKAVLKYTPVGHPDRETIPHVIGRIEAMLNRINTETGKAQNRLRLYKVDEKLVCPAIDRNDLRLTDDQRKLVRDSQLRKRGGNDSSIIQVLLLDHMLLMCRVKVDSHTGEEKYSIYKHPIPLQMLTICYPDDPGSMRPRMAACRDSSEQSPAAGNTAFVTSPGGTSTIGTSKSLPSATGSGTGGGTVVNRPTIISIDHSDSQKDKYMYPLQITHLGRRGFTVTLYANKQADRQQWYQCIEQQQLELMERHRKFELVPVACQFPPGIRVNTADVYDQGRAVVIGTDRGLYLGVAGKPRSFQLLSHLRHDRVYQVEIHESLNVMAMVADKDRNLY
ncbi:RHO1 GDP-GTP exchange protein 2, partial [Coemansia thaxteri]